jgi:hypothetical protein
MAGRTRGSKKMSKVVLDVEASQAELTRQP